MFFEEAVVKVEFAIRTLRNKFLKSPFSFYTESAIHCYLYYLLYQDEILKKKATVRIGRNEQTAQTILPSPLRCVLLSNPISPSMPTPTGSELF